MAISDKDSGALNFDSKASDSAGMEKVTDIQDVDVEDGEVEDS